MVPKNLKKDRVRNQISKNTDLQVKPIKSKKSYSKIYLYLKELSANSSF